MRKAPIWITDAGLPAFRPLETDTQADVCVVGGGMAGLSVAYLLTQAGKTVVVIDDGDNLFSRSHTRRSGPSRRQRDSH